MLAACRAAARSLTKRSRASSLSQRVFASTVAPLNTVRSRVTSNPGRAVLVALASASLAVWMKYVFDQSSDVYARDDIDDHDRARSLIKGSPLSEHEYLIKFGEIFGRKHIHVNVLFYKGYDTSDRQASLLTIACACGNLNAVKALLRLGADPKRPNFEPAATSALNAAIHRFCDTRDSKKAVDLQIIKLLLEWGADPNETWGHMRPLFYATDPELASLLLENGADVLLRNTNPIKPESPLDWAETQTIFSRVKDLFRSYAAIANAKTKVEETKNMTKEQRHILKLKVQLEELRLTQQTSFGLPSDLLSVVRNSAVEMQETLAPQSLKVFISYAWSPDKADLLERKMILSELANVLRKAGMNTWLDISQMGPGRSKNSMKFGIAEADYVIIIGSPLYKTKAEQPSGVATEVAEITARLKAEPKFLDRVIPIIFEADPDDSLSKKQAAALPASLPQLKEVLTLDWTFLKSRDELYSVNFARAMFSESSANHKVRGLIPLMLLGPANQHTQKQFMKDVAVCYLHLGLSLQKQIDDAEAAARSVVRVG